MNDLLPLLLLGSMLSGCGSCAQPGWRCGGDFRGGCFYSRGWDGVMRRCCTRCAPVCGRCGCGCGWDGWYGSSGCGCGRGWW